MYLEYCLYRENVAIKQDYSADPILEYNLWLSYFKTSESYVEYHVG